VDLSGSSPIKGSGGCKESLKRAVLLKGAPPPSLSPLGGDVAQCCAGQDSGVDAGSSLAVSSRRAAELL
jgi:hypothetical protein